MQSISPSRLAEMLNEGFEGTVRFSGGVFGRVSENRGRSRDFYRSEGLFSLSRVGRNEGVDEGSYLLSNSESHFYFKPTGEKPIKYHPQEKYEGVLTFPIDLTENAVLQIETRNIEF